MITELTIRIRGKVRHLVSYDNRKSTKSMLWFVSPNDVKQLGVCCGYIGNIIRTAEKNREELYQLKTYNIRSIK